jgi:hypothetical protein
MPSFPVTTDWEAKGTLHAQTEQDLISTWTDFGSQ